MNKNDNKGFTLLELVVVIAIASVILVVAGLSINAIFSNKSKSASSNIYNMLGTAQNLGMSKNNIYLKISGDANGSCSVGIVSGTGAEAKEVESKQLGNNLGIVLTVNTNSYSVGAGSNYYIAIDRKTGGFKGTYSSTAIGAASLGQCTHIKVGGNYDIELVPLTGKFFYND